MILNDRQIIELAEQGMIEPFVPRNVRQLDENGQRVISYGVSSFGYDLRVGRHFKVFSNVHNAIIDPKNVNERAFVDIVAEEGYILIPPNSFALAHSIEYFRIPRDIMAICVGKSTYARCGIITNVTPFEPGFEGQITLEISNTTPLPAKIYANEGICQVLFLRGEPCEVSYADRNGKYQGQRGIVTPRI
ncbi:MAG: dCTP deaminase [Bacillus thermozeamaize]|jgi:dCTP deaminase|uniref:dCTP deaminase n=1 Tax=Bacillus thermozeamaize TaxID=230954 RepID=A0A1Y3PPR1_9BACI|nr:MAG: dCTP deaminase [Bacillus thermozeamaize]